MTNQFHIQSLFISSTFRDMQVERDLIRDKLLPKLNELSADYKKIVEVVDLRWGIDTSTIDNDFKAQEKILNVCLDEIDRCKPYIIVLLGDRYGWTPEIGMLRSVGETKNFPVNEPKSVTALEIEYGALKAKEKPKAFFYFRSITNKQDIPNDLKQDYIGSVEERKKLDNLKQQIRQSFPDSIRDYHVTWNTAIHEVDGLEGFENSICDDILTAIQEDFTGLTVQTSWQEKELSAQERVLFQKSRECVGRENILNELNENLFVHNDPYVLLQGISGSGKSSLFSRYISGIQDDSSTEIVVFPFLCGTTGASSNLISMLQIMYYQIAKYERGLSAERGMPDNKKGVLPEDCTDIVQESDHLKEAGAASDELFLHLNQLPKDKKYILAVDALDELGRSDAVNRMTWLLVNKLPDYVRFFGTVTDGPEVEAIQAADGTVLSMMDLEDGDINKIIDHFQESSHKSLSPNVILALKTKHSKNKGKPACSSPLYLNLVLQDLKMIDRYEFASIESISDNRTEALDRFMLDRISGSDGTTESEYLYAIKRCGKWIGQEFTTACLGLLAVSGFGMIETDLEKCFEWLNIKWDSAAFAWLRQMLAPHFARSEYGEWDFSHQILRDTILSSMLSGEQKETYNKAVIAVLEGKSASDAAVIDDIAGRDIVFHYFCASEYVKIAKYIADRQILSDNRRVRQAFEVLLYLIGHCPANKKEKRLERIVRILDFTDGLSREQKFRLLLAYTIQLRNMIRPNVSISDSKAFIDKMIRYALELHDSANGLADHVVIMDAFIIAAMFYTDEDFQEEAKWAFEKFEEIELTYADLLKYFSFANAEVVSLAFRDQISLANKELFFYITAGDLKKANAVLRNIRSQLRFVRLHNLLFSSKAVLLAWALYEKSLFFLSEKLGVENSRPDALTSVVTAYKILFLYDREWFCTAAVETLYREFDLLTAKNSIPKLPGVYKRIGRVRSRENKLYSKFEHMLKCGNLEEKLRNPEISDPEQVQSANANLSMIEEIKTFHQRLESDEGVIEEALFLHEAGQSPEAVLQRYLPFVEWSEKQYKKHGGSLYAGNYARRLEKAADAYFNMEEYQESIDWYVKAIEVYETLLKHERYKDYEAFARCGENIGRAALSLDTEAYDEYAETAFDEVLSIRQGMAEMFPEADMENDLAVALYNLALAQRRNEKYDLSYANFQTAADTGFAAAVNYMGIAFEYGEGVEQDLDKAREYYRQACELGDESGKINLDRLEKESV